MIYELHISNFEGRVPGAKHYQGRVIGERPRSCHGGTVYNGTGTRCAEGHVLPRRIEWEVEASWTEERYQRWAAQHFEGDGPQQYTEEHELVRDAISRFLGELPARWWEEPVPTAEPGDELWLGYRAFRPEHAYPDGEGHRLAVIEEAKAS